MARSNSALEDIIEIAAKLPWWLNIALAVISHVLLHIYATQTSSVTPADINQLDEHAVRSIWQSLAVFMQYLLPLAFLLAALLSFIKRKRHADISVNQAYENIDSAAPVCPNCGNHMVKRIAKQDRYAGEPFWGCSAYPKCKSVLQINNT